MPGVSRKCKTRGKEHLTCEYCSKEFKKPFALTLHLRVHTGERPFFCNLCDYSAKSQDQLTVHVRGHLQERPFNCGEKGCNYSAFASGHLSHHFKAVHLKIFKCPISMCEYKTGAKYYLQRHMLIHETSRVKPFKCPVCPFQAFCNADIKNHMTFVHSNERNFKCPKSDEGCPFAAKTKSSLNRHLQKHGEKNLACPHADCEYKTSSKRYLECHQSIHDSEKRFKCKICDYSCRQSSALTPRTHTKETPYKCKIQGCKYQGKTSGSVDLHARAVHEKLRPFKCPFPGCPYAGAQTGHLKKHQERKHPN